MGRENHPGMLTEFVVRHEDGCWQTTFYGSIDGPVELQADTVDEARAEAAEYWGIDFDEVKIEL